MSCSILSLNKNNDAALILGFSLNEWNWSLWWCSNISAAVLFEKMKKGSHMKSYLISYANMTPGFKIWKQIDLYFHHIYALGSQILSWKSVNLYLVKVKIYLIPILSTAAPRCVQTASPRCVFKIFNFSRLFKMMF
jgi:hypothetical protein